MKLIATLSIFVSLLGCSEMDPSSALAQTDEMPSDVKAAWLEVQSLVEEANLSSEDDGTSLSIAIAEEHSGYILKCKMKIEMNPTTGGGVVLDPAHVRKTDAWFTSRMILGLMTMEVDEHNAFSRIDYLFDVNGIIVNAKLSLPVSNQEPAEISLYDPHDGRTYTWPEAGDVPATGPGHWCFKLFDCEACKENSVSYSPYEDEH